MEKAVIRKPVLNLIGKIYRGEKHRATQATYEEALRMGLAWWCTPAGDFPIWSLSLAGVLLAERAQRPAAGSR